ncbi:hypothetical protein JG688_00017694, partial [Phytophthora aleatoria]
RFKSSLLAQQEFASDTNVLGLASEVVEVSSGDEGPPSFDAPSGDEYEEKTSEMILDPPASSSQASGSTLSLAPGLGLAALPINEASLIAGGGQGSRPSSVQASVEVSQASGRLQGPARWDD